MRNLWIVPILALMFTGTGCETPPPQPVEIGASDMCTQCKMAISEKRYAAEAIDPDGEVLKFDSIDCMLRYASAHGLKEKARAWFVMDSEGNKWLDARSAFLVSAVTIPGPMGAGILATGDRTSATELSARFSGKVLTFADLWR